MTTPVMGACKNFIRFLLGGKLIERKYQQALYRVLHSVTIQYNTRIKYLPVTSSDRSDRCLQPLCCITIWCVIALLEATKQD